ncbi:MAG: Ralstonia phage phiRSL1, partial [Verrucomicrobiota bacterium]
LNGTWSTLSVPADYITSVSSPLSVTAGDLSIDLSSYLTTSTAASTYQTQAAMSAYLTSASAATTYAPLASPALTGNPTAPTATAGTSTTQLATTAFVTTADNLKANLASPTFTGTPAAPTAAANTNTTQLATTAFVVGQAGSSTPLVNGTAAVGTSLLYARQDHVHGTDTTRAPLASPTFTGTPAAPTATAGTSTTQIATTAFVTTADNLKANLASPALTGTPTAPTATAGTNTTQIATTAFVTAAVPAAATHTQAVQFASSTTYTKVIDAGSQVIAPSVIRIWPSPSNYNGTATSGAGASAALYLTGYLLTSPSAGVAGNARAFHGNIAADLGYMMWGGSSASQINFSRRVSMAFRFSQFPSSTASVTRVMLGKIHGTAVGDLTSRGIGVKYIPNGANFDFQLQVHNGTTLTTVTSSTQYAGGVADLEVVSDGAGNAVLYLNGAQVASTTGAPTGTTSANATVFAEVESTASTANQPVASIGRLYVNTLNF